MTFTVDLPVPPSANKLYRNVAGIGRAKTSAYIAWRREAVMTIFSQVPANQRIGGPVQVSILLPRKCRLDCDNTIKPTLDALVDSQRIDDDRNVIGVSAMKVLDGTRALVTVAQVEPKARAA